MPGASGLPRSRRCPERSSPKLRSSTSRGLSGACLGESLSRSPSVGVRRASSFLNQLMVWSSPAKVPWAVSPSTFMHSSASPVCSAAPPHTPAMARSASRRVSKGFPFNIVLRCSCFGAAPLLSKSEPSPSANSRRRCRKGTFPGAGGAGPRLVSRQARGRGGGLLGRRRSTRADYPT